MVLLLLLLLLSRHPMQHSAELPRLKLASPIVRLHWCGPAGLDSLGLRPRPPSLCKVLSSVPDSGQKTDCTCVSAVEPSTSD